jgi:alanine racemase
VAIVAAGYGDGLPRALPNGTPVLVRGARAELAGRVSMDMIAVDVTGIAGVHVGDPALLWGSELPVEEIASHAGTISYELLCAVSQRVPVTFV